LSEEKIGLKHGNSLWSNTFFAPVFGMLKTRREELQRFNEYFPRLIAELSQELLHWY
jgi:hypothetical protein